MLITRPSIQSLAWAVLLAAFGVFLLLIIGGPLGLMQVLRQSTHSPGAVVEAKLGTLSLSDGSVPGILNQEDRPRKVREGWRITSNDDLASAFVSFSDAESGPDAPGSTLSLEPHSLLEFRRLRRARFAMGLEPPSVELVVQPTRRYAGGLTAGATWGRRSFVIDARSLGGRPLGQVHFSPEARARLLFLDAARLRVVGIAGRVTVTQGSQSVTLGRAERSELAIGSPPSPAISGTVNIVLNADFDREPSAEDWVFGRREPDLAESSHGQAIRTIVAPDHTSVLRFERQGSLGASADLYFRQYLGEADEKTAEAGDFDVRRATYIGLRSRLRVLGQSVPGGGVQDSEYPLILRLRSIDQNAASPDGCEWTVGFYALPPPDPERLPVNGEAVALGEWVDFDTGNLLDAGSRFAFGRREPACAIPTHLIRVEVGVSGHDFASEIDFLEVRVE